MTQKKTVDGFLADFQDYKNKRADTRPVIAMNDADCDFEATGEKIWTAILAINNPPTVFSFGGQPARVVKGEPYVLDYLGLSYLARKAARLIWYKRRRQEAATLLREIGKFMLAYPPDLPILNRVMTTPTFLADGSLTTTSGYYTNAGVYLSLPDGQQSLSVPGEPTEGDVAESIHLLLDELLGGFPFSVEADRAHCLAFLITPFIRNLVDMAPAFLLSAPTPGTGKTLLAATIAWLVSGHQPQVHTEPSSEAEWQKSLSSWLLKNPAVIVLDNLTGCLKSASLDSVLTFPTWSARLLGTNRTCECPTNCLWLLTANNLQIDEDFRTRFLEVHLDARSEDPTTGRTFRHELPGWAIENRPILLRAILTLIQNWLTLGQPVWFGEPMGRYSRWSRVVGGILQAAGAPGFLTRASAARPGDELELLRSLVDLWASAFGSRPQTASSLLSQALKVDIPLGRSTDERSQAIALAKLLNGYRDRVVGDWAIRTGTKSDGRQRWFLERQGASSEGDWFCPSCDRPLTRIGPSRENDEALFECENCGSKSWLRPDGGE